MADIIQNLQINDDDARKKLEDLKKGLSDIIENANIELGLDIEGASQISQLKIDLESLKDEDINVNATVNQESIDGITSSLNEIDGKEINVDILTDDTSIKEVKTELDSLQDKTININTEVNNQPIDIVKSNLENLTDQTVNVEVLVDDKSIDDVKDNLKSIDPGPIKLDVKTDKSKIQELLANIGNVNKQVDILSNKKVNIGAKVDIKDIEKVKSEVEKIKVSPLQLPIDNSEAINSLDVTKQKFVEVKDEITTSFDQQIKLKVDAAESVTNTRELVQIIRELEGIALQAGESNQEAFIKATQAAGKLKDRVEDVKDATKTFTADDPLEGLSKGFGNLKNKLTDLDFQGFVEETQRLNVLSKQVSFGSLASSVKDAGAAFATLGKTLLANPLFLLAAVIVGVVAAVAELKKREEERIQASLAGQKQLQDAYNREYDARIKLIETVKGLSQAEIDALDKRVAKYGAVKERLAETDIYNIRKTQLKSDIDLQNQATETRLKLTDKEQEKLNELTKNYSNGIRNLTEEGNQFIIDIRNKRIESLKSLGSSASDTQKEELKFLEELSVKTTETNNAIVQNSADKAAEISTINKNAIITREQQDVNAIKDTNQRARAQNELDVKRARQEGQEKLDRLKTLGKEETEEYTNVQNSINSTVAALSTQRSELETNISKDVAEKRIKNQEELNASIISKTTEGSKERVESEKKAIDEILSLQTTYAKQLGISENSLITLNENATKEKKKIEIDYQNSLTDIQNEYIKSRNESAVVEAQFQLDNAEKSTKSYIELQRDLIEAEEKAADDSIEIEAEKQRKLKQLRIDSLPEGSEDRKKAEEELFTFEKTIQSKKEENTRQSTDRINQLYFEERDTRLKTSLQNIQNIQNELNANKKSVEERKELVEEEFTATQALIDNDYAKKIEDAKGNLDKIAQLKADKRAEEITAEKKKNDELIALDQERFDKMKASVDAISGILANAQGFISKTFDAVSQGISSVLNTSLNTFTELSKKSEDYANRSEEIAAKTTAVSQLIVESLSAISNIIQANSEERIQTIETQLNVSLEANKTETDSKITELDKQKEKGIITEQEYKEQLFNINKGQALKEDKLKKDAFTKEQAIKRKAFDQEKSIKIVQTIASTAQAVVTALTAGPIAGPILAGLAGAIGAAQIGIISAQKFPEGSAPVSSGGGGIGGFDSGSLNSSPQQNPFQAPEFFGIGGQQQGTTPPPTPVIIENNILETDITRTQRTVGIIETRASIV